MLSVSVSGIKIPTATNIPRVPCHLTTGSEVQVKEGNSQSFTTMDHDGREPQGLLNFLFKLGVDKFYPNKLTLHTLLEINKGSVYEEEIDSMDKIAWCFLRKLFKINAECRRCISSSNNKDDEDDTDLLDVDLYTSFDSTDNKINPLDLIVALFLCADSFLQQEMASKMSMCQFSVPLLLPHRSNNQCTLMLWALRDIIKEWRPHDLSESKGFVENSIVLANIPFYCFVRLKNCSLSKSQLLNHVLSSGQQSNNVFIHRDMKGGTNERIISSGLVEVCWYLPSGTKNLDKFPEPLVFANLRGDICDSFPQFSLLYQVSTAAFVFLDRVEEEEHKILTSLHDVKTKLFLVFNFKEGTSQQDMVSFQTLKKQLDLPKTSLKIKKPKENVAEFSEKVRKSITGRGNPVNIENMLDISVELGLYVDETTTYGQKKTAEETLCGIRVHTIAEYKKQQLPLQGDNWKNLSQLEMEACRLNKCSKSGVEEYKCELQAKKQKIRNEQSKYKLSRAMKSFIEHLSEEKRDFFLKWMKIKLNAHMQSDTKLSLQHNKLKEECNKDKKDVKLIAELYQALLDSSLGIEHYMREVGLIYEFSKDRSAERIAHLPGVAAEMLLDGFPLELLDGDASNIPETWVTDVLMELHKKAGEKSRLLVVTVLGVQSTGKSTLLNTMFGVQFPVSSGRCTRGAYMLFLRVGQDMKNNLKCDFVVLIDTEGLRSPLVGLPEESLEHDNQLATFVIGLSDVTIINVAMENSTEMKDTLQIATHAFLRMNEIGKKTVCHFVHQNVSAVSAHDKTMTERQRLLDQLNEITKAAAEMENLPSVKAFTDVLDYDIKKNNWNIPGLWHGTPPMASVNTGYSEAVADFKKNLLETMSDNRGSGFSQIPEFLEWIKSLWKAVKYENFLFSFRNTLVANAYDILCKMFSQWEWEFRKNIFAWQKAVELEIHNVDAESEDQHLNDLIKCRKSEVSEKLRAEEKTMTQKLENYYDTNKSENVNLIEKYKSDFLNSISSLTMEISHSVNNILDQALQLNKSTKEIQEKMEKYREVIEEQVMKLVSDRQQSKLCDEELRDEFEKMWRKNTENVTGLKEKNICGNITEQLRQSFVNKKVNHLFDNIGDLKEHGKGQFKVTQDHLKGASSLLNKNFYFKNETLRELQNKVHEVIESCRQMVVDVAKTNTDYHESFVKDLLDKIDESLKKHRKQYNIKLEFDLKLHICGIASQKFLEMHKKFLLDNDPRTQLEKFKNQHLSDFLYLYKLNSMDEKDNCKKEATSFVQLCIKPGVEENIKGSLGIDIVDEILSSSNSEEFSSRKFFQYNILKELLQKEDFNSFDKYIATYEIYVKNWIFQHILQKLSKNKILSKLKNNSLQLIVIKISEAITEASKREDGSLLPDNKESIMVFIENMHKHLNKDMLFRPEAEKICLFQIQSTCHPFINSLRVSLDELEKNLQEDFSKSEDISETLNQLPVKPQDVLFKRVFGCGQQCPFCKVPCETGSKEHKKHQTAVHRPQGFGGYYDVSTKMLVERLCTTDVHCQNRFRNIDTQYQWHPYKDYTTYYPDWHIPPDPTPQASDYWKYVLVQYNDQFAEKYKAKPADVPEAWKSITKEDVLKDLKDAFSTK